jgi:hypothetical protein
VSPAAALEPSAPRARALRAVPHHAAAGVHLPLPDTTDGPSRASFVTALIGILVPLLGVLSILLGAVGLARTTRRGTRGRGLARAGITLGVLQLITVAVVSVALYWAWDAYGADLRDGLHGVAGVSEQYAGLSATVDRFADGDVGAAWDLARDLGPSGIARLAADADELRGLARSCQDGDRAACTTLLDRLPDTPQAGS